MNVEIRTEAAQFPEKEYINGIFLAVRKKLFCKYRIFFDFPCPSEFEEKKCVDVRCRHIFFCTKGCLTFMEWIRVEFASPVVAGTGRIYADV